MLHCAASQGRYELVDFLLEKCFKDNVNDKNYLGETALHLAALLSKANRFLLSNHLLLPNILLNQNTFKYLCCKALQVLHPSITTTTKIHINNIKNI